MKNNTFTSEDDIGAIVQRFRAQLEDPTAPLTLIVRMQMKEGTRERVDAAFARARRPTLTEAGAISFDLNRDVANPNVVVVYERWRSLGDLEAHLRTPYIAALRAAFDELVEALPEFTVLNPAGEG
jgi:quinol monooxygenase YgiN